MRNGLAPILFSRPGWAPRGASLAFDFMRGHVWTPNAVRPATALLTTTRSSSGDYADNSAGVWSSFAANIPRITDKGLLVEEARTNLFLNSGVPATQSVTVVAASTYTVSAIGTGSITLSNAGSGTVSQGSPVTFVAGSTTLTLTTAGITGAFVNVNVELGAFATSPIRTTSAAATRAADTIKASNFSSWYNQSEGTFFVDFTHTPANSQGFYLLSAMQTVNTDGIYIWRWSGGLTVLRYSADFANVDQFDLTKTYTDGTAGKVAAAYKANDFAFTLDGAVVGTDASGSLPAPTELGIGNLNGGSSLGGYIRRVAYFPTRLTNAQLQALTQ